MTLCVNGIYTSCSGSRDIPGLECQVKVLPNHLLLTEYSMGLSHYFCGDHVNRSVMKASSNVLHVACVNLHSSPSAVLEVLKSPEQV
jgi:hypothetical protein